MKNIIRKHYTWLIIAFVSLFITFNYLQVGLRINWLFTEATTPFSDTIIDLGFYFSIIALSATRYKIKGGVIAALATFPILIYSHGNHMAMAMVEVDRWMVFFFSAFSGIIVAVTIGSYVNTSDKLETEHLKALTANEQLQKSLAEVKTISGLLPICASCKKIRNGKGYFESVEGYIREHSTADFTHTICDECMVKLYPDLDLKSVDQK
jgi:hypothetical protein